MTLQIRETRTGPDGFFTKGWMTLQSASVHNLQTSELATMLGVDNDKVEAARTSKSPALLDEETILRIAMDHLYDPEGNRRFRFNHRHRPVFTYESGDQSYKSKIVFIGTSSQLRAWRGSLSQRGA